jgi:hypothetical protein
VKALAACSAQHAFIGSIYPPRRGAIARSFKIERFIADYLGRSGSILPRSDVATFSA